MAITNFAWRKTVTSLIKLDMSFVCIAFIITKLIQMNDFPLLARYVTVGTGGMAWWTSCKMLHKRHLLNLGCRQLVPLCDVDSGHSFPLKKALTKLPPAPSCPDTTSYHIHHCYCRTTAETQLLCLPY